MWLPVNKCTSAILTVTLMVMIFLYLSTNCSCGRNPYHPTFKLPDCAMQPVTCRLAPIFLPLLMVFLVLIMFYRNDPKEEADIKKNNGVQSFPIA